MTSSDFQTVVSPRRTYGSEVRAQVCLDDSDTERRPPGLHHAHRLRYAMVLKQRKGSPAGPLGIGCRVITGRFILSRLKVREGHTQGCNIGFDFTFVIIAWLGMVFTTLMLRTAVR